MKNVCHECVCCERKNESTKQQHTEQSANAVEYV